jgi:hypothetical protein
MQILIAAREAMSADGSSQETMDLYMEGDEGCDTGIGDSLQHPTTVIGTAMEERNRTP